MTRYQIAQGELNEACEALDSAYITYDIDDEDCIMVDDYDAAEAEEMFDTMGIDYDII